MARYCTMAGSLEPRLPSKAQEAGFASPGGARDTFFHGESLAGRITYVDMGPFFVLELPAGESTWLQLWLRGGFPGSFLSEDDALSLRWRTDFIRTYLERDVPQFGPRIPAGVLERFWRMLAHGQGTLLNASRLAAALQVSVPTIQRYIDLLTDLLLVRRLPPFHRNAGKRLVKSPKIYVRDSGLVHALLGIKTHNDLAGHPVAGASWEGFVIENLLQVAPRERRQLSIAPPRAPRSVFCWKSPVMAYGHRN